MTLLSVVHPTDCPNQWLINQLKQLESIYVSMHDEHRVRIYRRCAQNLAKLPKITSISQLEGVMGFGKSVLQKIDEMITTGTLQKLQHFQKDPKVRN